VSNGVTDVSGSETRTSASGSPASSAAISASVVFAPCPISTVLVSTFRLSSALSLTVAADEVGVAMPLIVALMPFARIRLPSRSTSGPRPQPIRSAASCNSSV
jgi:hypothetical protein